MTRRNHSKSSSRVIMGVFYSIDIRGPRGMPSPGFSFKAEVEVPLAPGRRGTAVGPLEEADIRCQNTDSELSK